MRPHETISRQYFLIWMSFSSFVQQFQPRRPFSGTLPGVIRFAVFGEGIMSPSTNGPCVPAVCTCEVGRSLLEIKRFPHSISAWAVSWLPDRMIQIACDNRIPL